MQKIRKAVIPAAGFGTRFLPATKSMPKEMLPIIDKPAIHYAVEEAVKAGITEIIFITGRGKRAIEDYFDRSYELEDILRKKNKVELLSEVEQISEMADIVYLRQKEALGLGHAILRAKDWVGNEPFVVLLPDVLIEDCEKCTKSMVETYKKTGKSVVALQEIPWEKVHEYGIVEKEGEGDEFKITNVIEKPKREEAPTNLHILGRYIFTPEIFEELEKLEISKRGELELTDAIKTLATKDVVYGITYEGNYYDTGDKLGFIRATINFALKHDKLKSEFSALLKEYVDKQGERTSKKKL